MYTVQPLPWNLNLGLLLVRAIVGVVFAFHGAQKLFGVFGGPGLEGFAAALEGMSFPLPMVNAVLAGLAEFGGGVAILLGLGTRLVAIPLAFTMAVAAFVVHGSAFSLQAGGMEYALTLGIVSLAFVFLGPGEWSLDGLLWRPRATAPLANAKIEPRRAH
jgi:putative oxidoreductase